jgi:DNA adenine methylase
VRQRAFKCLFLNRTSFSGILAPSAGPIGGKTQDSEYKIDCRFTKETLIKRILRIAQYRSRVAFIWNLHWRPAISRIRLMQRAKSLSKSTFYYIDPPFFKKADSLYTFYFNNADHLALRDFLLELKDSWILSYDSCPETITLYKDGGFRTSNVNLIYTTSQKGERGLGKELIVSNLAHMVSELQLGLGRKATSPVHIVELEENVLPLHSEQKNTVARGRAF